MGPGIIASPRAHAGGARGWRALACVLLALAPFAPATAGTSDSANAVVALLAQGSITKTGDMDFGTIAPPNAAGTVVMTAQQLPTCTASAPLVHIGGCHSAQFGILYRNNKHVFIGDNSNGLITLTGPGGATMQVTNLTMSSSGLTGRTSNGNWDFGKWQVSDPNGFAQIFIGGTLHVAANQTPGDYSGTLTINVLLN